MKSKLIIAVLFILTVCGASYSQVKMAFVDSEVIINQLPEAQQVKKTIEDIGKLYMDTVTVRENEIKSKSEALKTKYEDAQKQVEAGKLNADQIKALESEMGTLQNELQMLDQGLAEYKQGIQQTLLQKQSELFKPIKEKITQKIELVAKELKYNFVLDKADGTVLYGDKELDITFKVLDKLK